MSKINLVGIHKKYGEVTAVNHVNLNIAEGEFATILGPSGSGKTTMLTMIAGFEEPTEGKILINNKDVGGLPSDKRNIGLVFQSYALFPHMNVFENIAFPLKVRRKSQGEIAEKVKNAMDIMKLGGFETRKVSQLSGGQQQRVALARAIVFNPDILLLDEPMAALDRQLRQSVQIELRQLQRKLGITTIAVTHDQEEALTLSDRIMIFNQGNIEQFGTPDELYNRPANRFVAEFLGSANLLSGTAFVQNGQMVARLLEGTEVPCKNDGMPAAEGHLMIRPEHISLSAPDAAVSGPALNAVVKSTLYQGTVTRHQLETATGKEVIVMSKQTFKEGENVKLHWDPQDSWFIAN